MAADVECQINYFPPDGPTVFYPGTAGYQRRHFDERNVNIKDVRGSAEEFSLDKNGFQVARNNWTPINHDDDDAEVRKIVYKETTELLKKITGCTDVFNFSHLVRFHDAATVKKQAEGLRDEEGLKAAGPTRFAHCDNSVKGAETVLRDALKGDEAEIERRLKGRWAIINTWRGLRQVTRDPLALLDSRTVGPEDMVGVFSAFPKKGSTGAFGNAYEAGEGFETAQIRANPQHQWWYCSNLEPEEVSKQEGRKAKAVSSQCYIHSERSWAGETKRRGALAGVLGG